MKTALALSLCAGAACAQEAIRADTRLSDTDFYRLVSCAAVAGGACQKETVRWSPADAQDISVGIVMVSNDVAAGLQMSANNALDTAIAEINASGANLHLTLSESVIKPDVAIYLSALKSGQTISGTGLDQLDGSVIGAARAQIWWRADFSIIEGAIVFANDTALEDVPSIMLEEITQTMGLLTDIDGSYYRTLSIFSETGNQLTRLGVQDIMALKRHYP